MALMFQVPVYYYSLQHRTLLSSLDTFTTGPCFCFGSAFSFLLELFLHSSPTALTNLKAHLSLLYLLPLHPDHSVLKEKMMKWFAIPLSSRKHFVITLHHDPSSSVALHSMAHSFTELHNAVIYVITSFSFLCLCFSFCLSSDG